MTIKKILLIIGFWTIGLTYASAHDWLNETTYRLEGVATAYHGDNTPLWLNANRYGMSGLLNKNGYLRAGAFRDMACDSLHKWGIGYGADLAVAHNFTSDFIVQQTFVEVRWWHAMITAGSKEMPMEMKNQELSTGSQLLGINARPVPQVRLALPEYWTVPLTRGWIALKGHIAYGRLTDSNWQEKFNTSGNKYQKDVIYHTKAGYLKMGDESRFPLVVEAGLEMATMFGGKTYNNGKVTKYKSGLKQYFDALIPFDDKDDNSLYTAEGDQSGSLLLNISYQLKGWKVRAYWDHYFNDGSAMYQLDYDGYGSGANWDKHEKSRYLVYDPKDGLWGLELTLPRNKWVSDVVAEYLYTKYQSGPIYYDHDEKISDHIGGVDDYCNHGIYTGWQHWGMVMGNPLYLSPVYNRDGSLYIKDNRFVAWHLGFSGNPLRNLHYRVLMTTQKGWGTYSLPYSDIKKNNCFMAELTYRMPKRMVRWQTDGWSGKIAFGLDHGELLGNNMGVMVSIAKEGFLH